MREGVLCSTFASVRPSPPPPPPPALAGTQTIL